VGVMRSRSARPASGQDAGAGVVARRVVAGARVGGVVRRWSVGAALAACLAWAAPAQGEGAERRQTGPPAVVPAAAGGDFARRVEIPGGRRLYLECRGRGGPTVILVSGLGSAADVWRVLAPGVARPSVLAGVARFTRVCAYDRPNTTLEDGRRSRSDSVSPPRTAADAVAELHALLGAARVPGPYVLVGHSFGGLIVRLYASTYARQVAGLVLVEATYELIRELFTPEQWAAMQRMMLERAELDPPHDVFDLDASFDQVLDANAARPVRPTMPLVVLTRGIAEAPPPGVEVPPGLPDPATFERVWQTAQTWLAGIVPYARHVIAGRSGHFIQNTRPGLVIDAVGRELRMVRPAAVRCRGGAASCRARVSLAGGASNKKLVIDLTDTDLRLVSVRPNRPSLRDAYGLSDPRQRQGSLQYQVTLSAAQSIPRGDDLIFTFRASDP
jgi:pimeloyl-ACP methyl ester carboxylesterase